MAKNPTPTPLPKKAPTKKLNWINCSVSMRKGFLAPFGVTALGCGSHIFTNSVRMGGTKVPRVFLNSVLTLWPCLRSWHQGGRDRVLRNPPALHLALHCHTGPRPRPTFSHRKLPKPRTALERKWKAEHRSRGWGEGASPGGLPGSWALGGRKWSEVKSLSRVRLFVTPWTVVYQAPPSMGVSRQECWSGLTFPSPADLPHPGIEPGSPTL